MIQYNELIGQIVVGYKAVSGKRFLAKLIAIDQYGYLFETRNHQLIRDKFDAIKSLEKAVA